MNDRVGIVGAGLSGLMAARSLQEAGFQVAVFDKGRRAGGRSNTREHGAYRFDHGAQFFTVRDDKVRPWVEEWIRGGWVAEWNGRLVRLQGSAESPAKAATRYVGVPGMIDVALHLAEEVDVRAGVRIREIRPSGGGWTFIDADGKARGQYACAVVAVPPAQAVPLLTGAPAVQARVAEVRLEPCWAGMFVFDRPLELGFDGAFVRDGPISWVARDSSKPGRPDMESWVIHATPDWTKKHSAVDRSVIPGLLVDLLASRFGFIPPTLFERAHRWGYALAASPGPGRALYDRATGLGACGDWCIGGRIEGALVSGMDIASQILE